MYGGVRYRAISKFALVVLRERNPSRQVSARPKRPAQEGCDAPAKRAAVAPHAALASSSLTRREQRACLPARRLAPQLSALPRPFPRRCPPQSCDGWKEVALHGEKLDVLRARFQSHQRKLATRRAGQAGHQA